MVCRKRSCYDTRNCFIDSLASRLHILQFVTWPISIFQADTEKNLAVPHTRLHRVMTRQQGGQGPHGLLLTAQPCPARAALARGSSRGTRPRGSRQGPGEADRGPGKPAGPRGRRPGPGGRRPGRAGLGRAEAASGPAVLGAWRGPRAVPPMFPGVLPLTKRPLWRVVSSVTSISKKNKKN